MSNSSHQWTTFQKGRLKVKACGCCGEMCLPSNAQSACEKENIHLSPIVRAGYVLSRELPISQRASQRVA